MAFPLGWLYYNTIDITGSVDEALTDYLVEIDLTYESGKMRTDFGDIRFALEDNTELEYCITDKTDSVSADFLVKIPTIPISPGIVTLYVYSGNSSATTTQVPLSAAFYDTFPGTSINTDNWDVNAVHTITNTVNNYLRITDSDKSGWDYWIYDSSDTGCQHQAKYTLPTDFTAKYEGKIVDTVSSKMGQGGLGLVKANDHIIVLAGFMDEMGGSVTPVAYLLTESTWSNVASGWDGESTNTVTKSVTSTAKVFEIRKAGNLVSIYVDNVKIADTTITSTVDRVAIITGGYEGYNYVDYVQFNYVQIGTVLTNPPTVGGLGTWQNTPLIIYSDVTVITPHLDISSSVTVGNTSSLNIISSVYVQPPHLDILSSVTVVHGGVLNVVSAVCVRPVHLDISSDITITGHYLGDISTDIASDVTINNYIALNGLFNIDSDVTVVQKYFLNIPSNVLVGKVLTKRIYLSGNILYAPLKRTGIKTKSNIIFTEEI